MGSHWEDKGGLRGNLHLKIKQTGVLNIPFMSRDIRPGARGGRDQFSWEQVKEDKQRLNYLGSSIHGLPDKFRKGAETYWYAKNTKSIPVQATKSAEMNDIKDKERQVMDALLGISAPSRKTKLTEHVPSESHITNRDEHTKHEQPHNSSKHLSTSSNNTYSRHQARSRSRDRNCSHRYYREDRARSRDRNYSHRYYREDRSRSRSPRGLRHDSSNGREASRSHDHDHLTRRYRSRSPAKKRH